MPTREMKKRMVVSEDIKIIDEALESNAEERVNNIHNMIDGKYQSCIKM